MKKLKKLVPVLLTLALALGCAAPALACTGVYVGSEVSANGSTYMGRNEDIGGGKRTKIFGYSPAADYPEDYVFEDVNGFTWPYGGHTYAYIYCKDSPAYNETMKDADGNYIFEAYAEAGQNEMGVAMSETVTTSFNDAAKAADPKVKTGLKEISIGTIILGKCATAKEAVDLMAKIIDEKGSGECNSFMISDPKETWYFEQLSGHQYAAVKMPADKVSIQPNLTLLGVIDVNDTENVVVSPDLVSLAEENGFLVTDADGKINVAKTYGSATINSSRFYQGLHYINAAAAEALGWQVIETESTDKNGKVSVKKTTVNADGELVNGADPDNGVELLLDPDHKLTTLEILRLLAYRGQDLDNDFNSNVSGITAIGGSAAESSIFETRKDMPMELATVEWMSLSPAVYSIFIPSYSAILTQVDPLYDETAKVYTENSMFWAFCQINILCSADKVNCGANVIPYFEAYQQSLIDQQAAVDAEMLALYEAGDKAALISAANALHKDLTAQAFAVADGIVKELEAYIEAGDTTAPFMPTAAVENVMPVYSLAHAKTAQTQAAAALLVKFAPALEKLMPAAWMEQLMKLAPQV